MAVVVSIDAGTTGIRAFAVNDQGAPIGMSYREFTQHFPQPGWVEHDAEEIFTVTQTVLAELAATLTEPVAAIGITDQRETIVAWDATTSAPLHRAIVWQDRRTAQRCDQLVADGQLGLVRTQTGLVLDPYFSASKIEWMLTQGGVPRSAATRFGTIDSWLMWKLTGGAVHATDSSNASRTMLCDIRTLEWSAELCDLFGVPVESLPEIRPSSGRFGLTTDACPLGAGIPISGVAGDQQASLFGQGCFTPGMTKNTYGTGSFVLMNVGDTCPDPTEGLLTTVAWTMPNEAGEITTTYALEGAIFVTGAAVQWLRDGLGIISESAEIGPLAESVDSSGGVVIVPAFTGLGSPYWDPYARGSIFGLTRGVGRAEIARAVVESMAYSTRDVLDAMSAAVGTAPVELRVDGGAAQMDLLLNLVAGQLGITVRRSAVPETTALGTAYMAGLAEGVWDSAGALANIWQSSADVAPPTDDPVFRNAAYATWQRAVSKAQRWEPAT